MRALQHMKGSKERIVKSVGVYNLLPSKCVILVVHIHLGKLVQHLSSSGSMGLVWRSVSDPH